MEHIWLPPPWAKCTDASKSLDPSRGLNPFAMEGSALSFKGRAWRQLGMSGSHLCRYRQIPCAGILSDPPATTTRLLTAPFMPQVALLPSGP